MIFDQKRTLLWHSEGRREKGLRELHVRLKDTFVFADATQFIENNRSLFSQSQSLKISVSERFFFRRHPQEEGNNKCAEMTTFCETLGRSLSRVHRLQIQLLRDRYTTSISRAWFPAEAFRMLAAKLTSLTSIGMYRLMLGASRGHHDEVDRDVSTVAMAFERHPTLRQFIWRQSSNVDNMMRPVSMDPILKALSTIPALEVLVIQLTDNDYYFPTTTSFDQQHYLIVSTGFSRLKELELHGIRLAELPLPSSVRRLQLDVRPTELSPTVWLTLAEFVITLLRAQLESLRLQLHLPRHSQSYNNNNNFYGTNNTRNQRAALQIFLNKIASALRYNRTLKTLVIHVEQQGRLHPQTRAATAAAAFHPLCGKAWSQVFHTNTTLTNLVLPTSMTLQEEIALSVLWNKSRIPHELTATSTQSCCCTRGRSALETLLVDLISQPGVCSDRDVDHLSLVYLSLRELPALLSAAASEKS